MSSNSSKPHNINNRDAEIQLQQEAQKLGIIGSLFGARENAALYLAGLIHLIVLIMLGTLMFIDETLRSDITTAIAGIGLTSLGFIGGLLSK
ncbi:MAG: hypothetical protein ISR52_02440 [Rhodospirillales bacterium]|nr:hypothetical protein [Rhodospirillales bacterium]